MARSDRPSGLTALAVVNFIFAAFVCVGILGMAVNWAMCEQASSQNPAFETVYPADIAPQMILVLSILVVDLLLLVGMGIGFLGLRRWGWWVGNFYVVFALTGLYAMIKSLPPHMGGGQFSMGSLSSVFYPVFLLLLLNLVFRRDLIK